MSVVLTYGTKTVTLTELTVGEPRTRQDTPQVELSAWGAAALDGTAYQSPFLWQVKSYCTWEEYNELRRIWEDSLADRAPIRLYDYRSYYRESSPRTRALAPGAVVVTDGTKIEYYAQYDVFMTGEPSKEMAEFRVLVEFDAIECRRVPA